MMKRKKMATLVSKILAFGRKYISGRGFCWLCVGLLVMVACDPDVKSHTKDVVINIDVMNVSAGYAQVHFFTNKKAFYMISIQPVKENIDPQKIAKTFMLLSLDSAYADYLYWRNKQLQVMTPFVADFASHSLQYGDVQHCFTLLKPNTAYWVYAFVVDANANKPAGQLFLETIHTDSVGNIPVYFEYRIDELWDYVYPKDSLGEINSTIPWVGETIDSITLREQGWRVPGEYFFERFQNVYFGDYERILYGIYVHKNDGIGDGTSTTRYEEGKTYYTGMAALDAPLVFPLPQNIYDIYRFTWHGDTTSIYMTPDQSTDGNW